MLPLANLIGFPSDDIPRESKATKEFNLTLAQAVYSRWYNNRTLYGMQAVSFFHSMNDYAEGRQTNQPYRDWFLGGGNGNDNQRNNTINNYMRKGYANVSYDIVSPAPKFVSIIKSVLAASDYQIKAESLSPTSKFEKNKKKWRMYYEAKVLNPLRKDLGIPEVTLPWEPGDEVELEMYERYHGFQLPLEMALQDIAKYTETVSDWDGIRLRHIEKLVQTNFIVGKVVVDKKTGVTKHKWINPANFITAYVDENYDQEPPFAGDIERVKLSDIKESLLEAGATLEQLKGIARMYYPQQQGYNSDYSLDYNYKDPVTGRFSWEDFEVEIMNFEYISAQPEFFTGRETKNGNYVYHEEKFGEVKKNYSDGRKRQTSKTIRQDVYEGRYVVGTNFIFNYGLQKNIMRDTKGNAVLSYYYERIPGKSITERWKPHLDSLMMTWIKLQAAKWSAAPKGLLIDIGVLSNMDLGSGKMTPLDIIRIRRQSGNQFINSKTDVLNKGGGYNSITELPGGIGPQLQEWLTCWRDDMDRCMDLAGITPSMAALPTTPSEKGLGVAEMEVDATNHALYELKKAMERIKVKAAKKAILKTRTNIRFDKSVRDYYANILGDEKMNALEAFDDLTLEQLGIDLTPNPSPSRKRAILEAAQLSMQAGKNGVIGIGLADYLYIEKAIENNQVDFAAWYMTLAEEKQRKIKMAESKEMQQVNQQVQGASLEKKAEVDKQLAEIEAQLVKMKEELITQRALELESLKHQNRMAELKEEGTLEEQKSVEISGNL